MTGERTRTDNGSSGAPRTGRHAHVPLAAMLQQLRDGLAAGDVPSLQARHVRMFFHERGTVCSVDTAHMLIDELAPAADPSTAPATVASRVAAARRARGWHLADLARRVGLSHSYISLIEAGRRIPGERGLRALADALDVEPDWLRSGGRPAGRRAAELLRFAHYAFDHGDHKRAASLLEQVLRAGPGGGPGTGTGTGTRSERQVQREERDRAELLYARACHRLGRRDEAVGVLRALLRRRVHGSSDLPVMDIAEPLVAALAGTPGRPHDLSAEAIRHAEYALSIAPHDAAWWRMAATCVLLRVRTGQFAAAAAQGRAWLEEAPGKAGSEQADLLRNLAMIDEILGHPQEALDKIGRARAACRDTGKRDTGHSSGALRVALEYADILLSARPDRLDEVIRCLDELRTALEQHGNPWHAARWTLVRARAGAIAGHPEEALRLLAPLREDAASATAAPGGTRAGLHHVEAEILAADVHAAAGDRAAAGTGYRAASTLLRALPPSSPAALLWRYLGDRLADSGGNPEEVLDAYRRAMDMLDIPGCPPPTVARPAAGR